MAKKKKSELKGQRSLKRTLSKSLSILRYGLKALGLVWKTSRSLTLAIAIFTLVSGLSPAAIAYVGKLRAVRFNKVPNIKPELVGWRSRPTNSLKSGMVLYLFACP
jgi:hypothetical protein